ncbi:cation:proton antiporter [Corynebacterium aquatimens]|uniref:CPA1 family monovalent cation:H+ antiporter n=1 Tax=Corynebacterium aquatimens TaxID=1190508 RepID=A0A931E2Z5_9CORY|nr:sodium:proton antiporter [Corynebacterium aquatimens]MBG6122841.1 CPA1 family monovalent cation:H+ antiporter [Corynebacterium aquatimens]WJY66824.1 Sodium, potassium, lithium and rubidium/H(+) antiporter [Corynebacterium aquatimens]
MSIFIAVIALLLATALVAALGERTGLPWPALLTIAVAPVLFIPGIETISIPAELILPIFLPPLLWSLARRTSWGMIRAQLNVVLTMSVVLVFLTIAALTATSMWLMPGVGIAGAMVLASAIAPPDPVAVDAVAGPAGIPKRITGTLQTEGLFNDAASIVAFNVALTALVAGSEVDFSEGFVKFLYSAVAAVIIGLVVGRLAAKFVNTVPDSVIRTAFTWVIPFAVFIAAEEIHASGVIAIVIAAVEMSSRATLTAEDRLSGHSFWETVEMLFTGVAFGLIGMSVRDAIDHAGTMVWEAVGIGLVLSVVAFAVRFLWMWVLCRVNRAKDRHDVAPLRLQEVLLMTWAGMRGLVTLALVLSIPAGTTKYHHELSVIALSVLTFTMVIPGMLLPWLVRQLDLEHGPDAHGDKVNAELNERAYEAARRAVQEHGPALAPESFDMVQEWLDTLAERRQADPEGSRQRRESFLRARKAAADMQRIALEAATAELQSARKERQYNPADVDAVLEELDRMVIAKDRHSLSMPPHFSQPD